MLKLAAAVVFAARPSCDGCVYGLFRFMAGEGNYVDLSDEKLIFKFKIPLPVDLGQNGLF